MDETITTLISVIAGPIHNLASQGDCKPYLVEFLDLVMKNIESKCGCDDYFVCRDLNRTPIPHPISFPFQPTCKKTATKDCRSSVHDLFYVWSKVPTKDDKICSDAYNITIILANSCI